MPGPELNRPETRNAADLHVPVLCREVVECFASLASLHAGQGTDFVILDGTLGMGGHSEALLQTYPNCRILGLDRDTEALDLAGARLAPFGERIQTRHCRFGSFPKALHSAGLDKIDGAIIDIGVSSLQLDEGGRGFSVHADGPLDMRMDGQDAGTPSAADLVNSADEQRLKEIIASYGEDPMAGRIARAICQERSATPITSTKQLADLVWRTYPAAWRTKSRHHPATRTFQALRMVVNDELGELERYLSSILGALRVGGICCVVTFHSLEDRLVKKTMKEWAQGCLCPPHVAVCRCHHKPEVELLTKKPLTAGAEELARNPRASSAKLRACRKILDWQPQDSSAA